MVTLDTVRENHSVRDYLEKTDRCMISMGYTEHGVRHAGIVAEGARSILIKLGRDRRQAELAAIAGYLHDLGNLINRENHALTGSSIARDLLEDMGMASTEVADVVAAIGHHQEENGDPMSDVSSALILADKIDVHRGRVRKRNKMDFDTHDRVNYSAERSVVQVSKKRKMIRYELTIDTKLSQVMEYFEIFMSRMVIARRAAAFLGCSLGLVINGAKML
ncbi:MAG: HD domain-containing protein [Candidatus Aureabacteria bacterium]|nr:HD domain-containing protein [Candidatus Auribacterota bacterium]